MPDEPARPENAIHTHLKNVGDDCFDRSIHDPSGAYFIENCDRDATGFSGRCLFDNIGKFEIQAARDLRSNDAGGVAGIEQHSEGSSAVEKNVLQDQGVPADRCIEDDPGLRRRWLSGGRDSREGEKAACKSHASSLRRSAGERLEGGVICLSKPAEET
jgi:hypothetical protein